MGQQSSQIASPQSPSLSEEEAAPNADSASQPDAASRAMEDQARRSAEANARSSKKRKRMVVGDQSPNLIRKKKSRSFPQSFRGTNIQPDTETDRTATTTTDSWVPRTQNDPSLVAASNISQSPDLDMDLNQTQATDAIGDVTRHSASKELKKHRKHVEPQSDAAVNESTEALQADSSKQQKKRKKKHRRSVDIEIEQQTPPLEQESSQTPIETIPDTQPSRDSPEPTHAESLKSKKKKKSKVSSDNEPEAADVAIDPEQDFTSSVPALLHTPVPQKRNQNQLLQNGSAAKAREPSSLRKQMRSSQPDPKTSAAAAAEAATSDDRADEEVASANASGPFTDEEKACADRIFAGVCRDEGITDAELKRRIAEEWRTLAEFKHRLAIVFPYRTRKAVYNFCVRRYHNFDTGPWSENEEKDLKAAWLQHPGKWVEISKLVGRSPTACRDRYNNYLHYEGSLESGPWDAQEEQALLDAVADALRIVKEQHPDEDDADTLESYIEWGTIADVMGGKRSKKRCSEKYRKLKHRLSSGAQDTESVNEVSQPNDDPLDSSSQPRSLRNLDSIFTEMEPGDWYDALTEIHETFRGTAPVFRDDSTLWAIVATANPHSRFSSRTRRRIYHALLDQWQKEKGLRRAKTLVDRARWLADKIGDSVDPAGLDRSYRADHDSTTAGEKKKKTPRAEKKTPRREKKLKAPQFKSAERVTSETEDEGEDELSTAERDDVVANGEVEVDESE